MMSSHLLSCTLLAIVLGVNAIQHNKDAAANKWSPLDLFRTPDNVSSSNKEEASVVKNLTIDGANVTKSNASLQHVGVETNESVPEATQADGNATAAKSDNADEEPCEEFCTDHSYQAARKTWEEKCAWSTCTGCDACQTLAKKPADTMEHVFFAKGDTTKPRMLVTEGCDGSTAVIKHAHFLLALHGIQTPVKDSGHVLAKEYSEIASGRNGVPRAMAAMHKDYQKQNKTSLFKAKIGRDEGQFLSNTLSKLDTLVVLTARRNTLDQLVCMVKDCFAAPSIGHPMMGGNKSDLCLKRRKMNTTAYKAFVEPITLVHTMLKIQERALNATNALKNLGYKAENIATEDLLDFQWSEEAVWIALPAWKRLLLAWGVRPSAGIIEKYLTANVGVRATPMHQKDAISNFDDVETELNKHQKFSWMLDV